MFPGRSTSCSQSAPAGGGPPPTSPGSAPADRRRRRLVCLAILAVLAAWSLVWPYTGDGDSALHYLNLRDAAGAPVLGLSAWARPGFVLLMALPAAAGITAVRLFAAVLSTILAWQTMRLADRLQLPNATLAGVLLLAQPLFFALASDTMTEMPTALVTVLAIRLWWGGRRRLSCLLAGLLPLVRPEGFFLAAMWGGMVLASPGGGAFWRKRAPTAMLLGIGVAGWVAACWAMTGDPLWFMRNWSWPVRNYAAYGRGMLLHHVILWPYYCGPVLIVLFLAGLAPSARRAMGLPWAVWGLFFGLHSLLWWRGWFGSVGLMRIQACTAPVTALVCLYGWNALAGLLRRTRLSRARVPIGAAAASLAILAAMLYYYLDGEKHRCYPIRQVALYLRQHDLFEQAPRVFFGDHMLLADLRQTERWAKVVRNSWDPHEQLRRLAELPPGSLGVWDNQRAEDWYDVKVEDITALGYQVVHAVHYAAPCGPMANWLFNPISRHQEYVVLRKVPDPAPRQAARVADDPCPPTFPVAGFSFRHYLDPR